MYNVGSSYRGGVSLRKGLLSITILFIVVIVGCSGDDELNSQAEAEDDKKVDQELEKYNEKSYFWDYHFNVDISHNFEGLDIEFQNIRLSTEDDSNYIGLKVDFKNLSHDKFKVYPGQMEIKLDNGEEISYQDSVATFEKGDDEISEKGNTYEGFYVFEMLTPVRDIEEIEVSWSNFKMGFDDEVDDHFEFKSNLTVNY